AAETSTTGAVTTTEAATTQVTSTTASTSGSEKLEGKFCGTLYGQRFSVDFEEGHATVSVLGESAGADYTVDGTNIVFSNYDPMLQKLMDTFNIKKIEGTIVNSSEVHIKADFLIDTTLTSC
ncbi:hypothetical protein FOL47_010991, partial [Perkinsus chesapeaki]